MSPQLRCPDSHRRDPSIQFVDCCDINFPFSYSSVPNVCLKRKVVVLVRCVDY